MLYYVLSIKEFEGEMKKLVLATNNVHKVTEIKAILGDYFAEIVTMREVGLDIDIEETGTTFEENSFLKASTVCRMTNLPALADDSGLCVDALHGAPGVYSARYAGEEHDDQKNIDKLLANLREAKDRRAYFTTVLTLCYPDGRSLCVQGRTEGEIAEKRFGIGGFGYDPVFFSYDLNKTFGEATAEEKNAVSHRARALAELERVLAK